MLGGYVHKRATSRTLSLFVLIFFFSKITKRTIYLVELLTTAFLLSLHIQPYIDAEGTCKQITSPICDNTMKIVKRIQEFAICYQDHGKECID